MAGLGEIYSLNESQLRAAFDAAKAQGQDFVVKVGYSAEGAGEGASMSLPYGTVDHHEAAYGVSRERAADDLYAIYKKHGVLNIKAAYDLRGQYYAGGAVKSGDKNLLPAGALEGAQAKIRQVEARAAEVPKTALERFLGL